ncbi:MAG: fibronectin type III domain-containing protein [Thermoplasmata archaeon]
MREAAKHRVLAAVLLVLGALLTSISLLPSAMATTLYVGGAGPGNYTTIQAAIDAASPGDTVYVYNGTYPENVHIWKSVSLVGEEREGTIIDGGGIDDVVRVEADNVLIMSFTLMNSGSGYPDAGISFQDMWNGQATYNLIMNSYLGVYASRYAEAIGIANNDFLNMKSDAVLADETQEIGVGDNNITGSWVVFGGFASGVITGNYIDGGGIALAGMDGWAPYSTFVGANYITNGGGIRLGYTWNCFVAFNTVVSNSIGIGLYLADGTTVDHNNIIDNVKQALDYNNDGYSNRTNTWDTGSEGNYWSDYTGEDLDGDSIGDTPYVIDGDSQDRYPLMSPYVSPPSPPRDLKAQAGNQSITLTWKEPVSDGGSPITNYSIYRGTRPGSYAFIAEVGNVTNYTDNGTVPGGTYYYTVSARNEAGESSKSNEASATVPSSVKLPSDVIRVPGVDNISLNWTTPQPPIPGSPAPGRKAEPIESDNILSVDPEFSTSRPGTRKFSLAR